MGYEEKFLYCENDKDTKALLNMLKKIKHKDFKILEILTLKRNWNARYRNVEGISINGKTVPFTFTSTIEMENPDLYYRRPSVKLTDDDIADMKNGNASQAFGEEHEHFFNKNDTLIWVCGDRGCIVDGYSLFGISNAAENILFQTMHDEDFPKQFLADGKLDIVNALPYANNLAVYGLVSKGLLTDDEARIIKETKTISLDGIPKIDDLLKQTDLFRRKPYTK